jgi:hypothetical protein
VARLSRTGQAGVPQQVFDPIHAPYSCSTLATTATSRFGIPPPRIMSSIPKPCSWHPLVAQQEQVVSVVNSTSRDPWGSSWHNSTGVRPIRARIDRKLVAELVVVDPIPVCSPECKHLIEPCRHRPPRLPIGMLKELATIEQIHPQVAGDGITGVAQPILTGRGTATSKSAVITLI